MARGKFPIPTGLAWGVRGPVCLLGHGGGGRGLDRKLPCRANAILQDAKAAIETSGNLKRVIRDTVVEALHALHEMILRLADSRSRHLTEVQRVKMVNERRVAALEAIHSRRLQEALEVEREERRNAGRAIEALTWELRNQREYQRAEFEETLEALKSSKGAPDGDGRGVIRGPVRGTEDIVLMRKIDEIRVAITRPQRDGGEVAREELRLERKKERKNAAAQGEGIREGIRAVEGALGALGEEVRSLGAVNNTRQIITRIEEEGRGLKEEATRVKLAIVEGFSEMRDEITAAAVLRHAVPSLREELDRTGLPFKDNSGREDPLRRDAGEREWVRVESRAEARRQSRAARADPDRGAPSASFPLLVESVDPRHTSTEIIGMIKAKVNVVELGIGVETVRKLRNQKASFGLSSEAERGRLLGAIKEKCPGLTVTTPHLKNPLIRLAGVTRDIPDSDVPQAILNQNGHIFEGLPDAERELKVQRRTKGRTDVITNVILEVSPSLWSRMEGKRIRLGYQVVPAYDQSPVIQCYRCVGFGHFARDCGREPVCAYCLGGHESRRCGREGEIPQCKNCRAAKRDGVDHSAFSRDCPEWQKWDRLARASVRYC
ncbi:uncharacterized protein [Choristoneura fumiferana]|uniref:uncharacterized protein n=1 Tax=Choristoneura fumiferana TaxID=7141 RepID=UPI003D155E2C